MKWSFLNYLLALVLAPLLGGIINRTKAICAGRHGQHILQSYYDLFKLIQRGSVFSTTTTWIFQLSPVISFSAIAMALMVVPMGGQPALIAFSGDLFLFIYLLALARFSIVLGALDTGSSFEGMGASREVQWGALTEPGLLLGLLALALPLNAYSLSSIYSHLLASSFSSGHFSLLIVGIALLIIFLADNSRIPFDDPNTHLELTMIHEVMVLDYTGFDFGIIQYTALLKFWALGSLITGLFMPASVEGPLLVSTLVFLGLTFLLAIAVGIIESTLARFRLIRIPHLLLGALTLSILALILVMR